MKPAATIEPLSSAHDRQAFDSGVEALDRYLRERASQDIRRRLSNCFVALDKGGRIAGYYTLAATGLPLTALADDEAKRLPRYPLLPAGLIGRLAVHRAFRGLGLGAALVVDAIERSIAADPAIFALVVDAKDEAAAAFYRHLGFQPFVSKPMSLFLPLAEAARRLA
ncbi:MAG: GNAT family N-acetyltransferase [Alphaproteobacteria bacterium]|nr:GNAT family N-acetyltransferase [Alphaproteobacteria bacterium]